MKLIILILALLANSANSANSANIHDEWEVTDTPETSLHAFTLILTPDLDGVIELERWVLEHSSNIHSKFFGSHLSIDKINQMVATPIINRKSIIDRLQKEKIICSDLYDAIGCVGKIKNIDYTFGTQIRTMRRILNPNKKIRTSVTPYVIPDWMKEMSVVMIDGLSNPPKHLTKLKMNMKSDNSVDPGMVSREVLERMYNLYPTYVGSDSNVSVGAMEFEDTRDTDGFDNRTMLLSQTGNGVPLNPITTEHLIGRNGSPDAESDLDVQVMYWAASDAQLYYETTDHWMYSWAINFFNRPDVPEVVSVSWGWSEVAQCTITNCNSSDARQYVNSTNLQFLKMVARGITIVVASGDAGSPGRTNEGCDSELTSTGYNHINPIFPGTSPWVLSVGATYVVKSDSTFHYESPICSSTPNIKCANGLFEQSTTYDMTQWTSGAGFDHWNPTPSWQAPEVKSYLASGIELPDSKYFNRGGRAYPDISAFGHNCVMHSIFFGWDGADGTSCATPIMAGGIANLNGFLKSIRNDSSVTLGFVNPLIYQMGRNDVFNDVLVGNSSCTESQCCGKQYGFVATTGWDVASGWGTPNFEEMKKWIATNII